jgi:membrane fusion protein (multidrug efflux system)
MRRLGVLVAALLAGALVCTASGCGHGSGEAEAAAPSGPAPLAVTVAPLERRAVERAVPVEGTLKGWEEVKLSAKKGGRVARVRHDMGDRVEPGAVLVELDPVDADLAARQAQAKYLGELAKLGLTPEQASEFVAKYGLSADLFRGAEALRHIRDLPSYKQAQATRDKARQQLDRQQQLFARGVGTMQDLQNLQNDFAAAEAALANVVVTAQTTIGTALASRAALDQAEQDLKDMVITAPRPATLPDGITNIDRVAYGVSRRAVSEGQMLKDGEVVFDLVIEDPVRLWAAVPERFRAQVAVGQEVRINAMARPGETFTGAVARINPAVDPTSRTFQVEAVVPNPQGKLRPGGFAKGEVITDRADEAIIVPIESIYSFAGVTKVYLVENGRSRGYAVETGRQLGDRIEVIPKGDPLPDDGQVVTTGQSTLAKLAEDSPVVVRAPGEDETPAADAAKDGEASPPEGAGAAQGH